MIFGIGVDLVETSRIERLLAQYGERFARRVLTDLEWPGYFRYPVTLKNISVVQNKAGKPGYVLSEPLTAVMRQHEIAGHYLTISDEKSMACAVAVIEK